MKPKIKPLMFIRIKWFNFKLKVKRLGNTIARPEVVAIAIGLVATGLFAFGHSSDFVFTFPKDAALLFTSAGLVGGALAILVTLNTLLLQNALEKLPARIYRNSTSHKGLNAIYIALSSITILLFALGIVYLDGHQAPRGYVLRAGLIADVWAFVLIFIYLRVVINRIDPSRQIKTLSLLIKANIDKTEKIIAQYTKLMSKTGADATYIEADVRKQLQPRTSTLYGDFQDLAGWYRRLAERGDKELALSCLRAITASAYYLYTKRSKSALALPTDYAFTPKSDLSDFSLKVDEILLPVWKSALQTGDVDTIREILSGYRLMAIAAIGVQHKNYPSDNPLFPYVLGGLKKIINLGIEFKNQDATFHSTDVLKDIAVTAFASDSQDRYMSSHVEDMYKLLNLVYVYAVAKKDTTVMKVSLDASMNIFTAAMLSKELDERTKAVTVEQFAKTLQIANAPVNRGRLLPGDEIMNQEFLIQSIFGAIPKKPRKQHIRKMLAASRLLLDALSKSITDSKTTLNIDFERYFELSGEAAVDFVNNSAKELSDKDIEDLRKFLETLVNLTRLSIEHYDYQGRSDGQAETYLEKLSHIGIYAASLGDNVTALLIINGLMDIAEQLMSMTRDVQYVEHAAHRATNYAGYIAAVSHAKRHYRISSHYRQRMHHFEDLWITTLFPNGFLPDVSYLPSPYKARDTFRELLHGFGTTGLPTYFEYPQDRLMREITTHQLRVFNDYLWRDKTEPQSNVN